MFPKFTFTSLLFLSYFTSWGQLTCPSNAIICDSLDEYNLGSLNDTLWWTTWDGTGGKAYISNEQALSGTKSIKIDAAGITNPAQDVILRVNDLTTGRYLLQFQMFVPTGKAAYFNVQRALAPHNWGMQVSFLTDGSGNINSNTILGSFTYPHNQWFPITLLIDMDADYSEMYVDNIIAGNWQYSIDGPQSAAILQWSGIDFFGENTNNLFYIDNVEVLQLPSQPGEICADAINIQSLLGGNVGQTTSSGLYNDVNSFNYASNPIDGFECFFDGTLDRPMWFTFSGDGNKYFIESGKCNATDYVGNGDLQMSVYTGALCSQLSAIDCNEDSPNASGSDKKTGLALQTQQGLPYYLLVDLNNTSAGSYCLNFTRLPPNRAITFQVDMTLQTISPNGIHVMGDFQNAAGFGTNWQPNTISLSKIGSTNVYGTTVFIPSGDWQYKFVNGDQTGNAEQFVNQGCINSSGNRVLQLTNDTTVNYCFNYCKSCSQVLGTETVLAKSFSISPNPSYGDYSVSYEINNGTNLSFDVYNITGELILSNKLISSEKGKISIDLRNNSAGIYLLKISDSKETVGFKLIKL